MAELASFSKHGNVGVIALNNPPVNALSHALRLALQDAFTTAIQDPSIEAILLCCEGRTFVAGADIREFDGPPLIPDVPETVEFVGSCPKPVTAALHGTALGGGVELALACHFRVSTPDAKVGFPEVGLGILPGAGGTQRLPRLVGVRAALDLIVGGAPITAPRAVKLGLIDQVIQGDFRTGALAFVERVVAAREPWQRVSDREIVFDEPGFFDEYQERVAAKQRGFLAPSRCIAAVRAAVELPFAEGLKRERELFVELMNSPQSKAQRHAFFGEREVARSPLLPADVPANTVRTAAVVGADGTASKIAETLAGRRVPVTLLTAPPGREHAEELLRASRARALTPNRMPNATELENLRLGDSYDDLGDADLVVVTLSGPALSQALAELDAKCRSGAVFAVHAHGVDVQEVASASKEPGRVIGLNFEGSRLMEVLRAPSTTPEACATAMKFSRPLGKVAVLEATSQSSAGARLRAAYVGEALCLLEEGALPAQVDRVLFDFGFPRGPFSAWDRAGLDVDWVRGTAGSARTSSHNRARRIVDELRERGRLGESTQAGFYFYDQDGTANTDPEVEAIFVKHSESVGIARRSVDDEEVRNRCIDALINEGARLVGDGLCPRALEVDMVAIHGLGYPVYLGGPLFHATQLGLESIYQRIRGYAGTIDEGWTPAPALERLVREGHGFYP